jgi:tRNA 2-selenouridine synthase
MRDHYDPAYRRASAGSRDLGEIVMDGDVDRAAEAISASLSRRERVA